MTDTWTMKCCFPFSVQTVGLLWHKAYSAVGSGHFSVSVLHEALLSAHAGSATCCCPNFNQKYFCLYQTGLESVPLSRFTLAADPRQPRDTLDKAFCHAYALTWPKASPEVADAGMHCSLLRVHAAICSAAQSAPSRNLCHYFGQRPFSRVVTHSRGGD